MVGVPTSMTKPKRLERVPWWALVIAVLLMLLSMASGVVAAGFAVSGDLSDAPLLIVAILLIVGGPVAGGLILDSELKLARARNLHPRCPRCDYDLRYLPERRCPECGETW